jgi:hypothetical protein
VRGGRGAARGGKKGQDKGTGQKAALAVDQPCISGNQGRAPVMLPCVAAAGDGGSGGSSPYMQTHKLFRSLRIGTGSRHAPFATCSRLDACSYPHLIQAAAAPAHHPPPHCIPLPVPGLFLVRGIMQPAQQLRLARHCLSTFVDSSHETNLSSSKSPLPLPCAAGGEDALWRHNRDVLSSKLRLSHVTRQSSHVTRDRWSLLGLRYNWTERSYSNEGATPIPDVVAAVCRSH